METEAGPGRPRGVAMDTSPGLGLRSPGSPPAQNPAEPLREAGAVVALECPRASPFLRMSLSLCTSVPACISRGTPACRPRSSRPGRSRAPASPSLILVPGGVRDARVPACLSPCPPIRGSARLLPPSPLLGSAGSLPSLGSPPWGLRAAAGSVDRAGPRRPKPSPGPPCGGRQCGQGRSLAPEALPGASVRRPAV